MEGKTSVDLVGKVRGEVGASSAVSAGTEETLEIGTATFAVLEMDGLRIGRGIEIGVADFAGSDVETSVD